ncbi:cytochrome P450 [Gigaspora rosea]|uniref:Cytochrome P450 n=1 Tax=Gigaspora rosea TaxID=44941 RepID=A0A397W6J4_9GLOM|nr:cytochrome P450 [Gigaspora rosea]
MIGIRMIIINRAEHADKFISPSTTPSDMTPSDMKHLMRTDNKGLLSFFDLENKGVAFNHSHIHWKLNRQLYTRAMKAITNSEKTCRMLNDLFNEMMAYWIYLKNPNDNSTIIDAVAWMVRFSNDFISAVVIGDRSFAIEAHYHKLKNHDMSKEMSDSEHVAECITNFVNDNQTIFMPKILRFFPVVRDRVKSLKHTCDFTYNILVEKIRKRRKVIEKTVNSSNFDSKQLGNDLMTYLIIANTPYETGSLKSVDPSLLRPMTDDEVRGPLFDSLLGSDTIANTLSFVLYYISRHPNVKEKLLEEIRTVFKDDMNRPATLDDLNKLRYCEAIIKETTRIRPTAGMISRVTSQPDEIAGYNWPSGVFFNMYVRGINNNPLYWKDPDKFMPERFYGSQNNQKYAFTMFGGGFRMCIGRNLAMLQMKLLLALLYRKVDIELVDMKASLNLRTSATTVCINLPMKVIHKNL